MTLSELDMTYRAEIAKRFCGPKAAIDWLFDRVLTKSERDTLLALYLDGE